MVKNRSAVAVFLLASILAAFLFGVLPAGAAGSSPPQATVTLNAPQAVESAAPAISNSTWMGDIARFIEDRKLNEIAVPGTHDSGTCRITPRSRLAGDGNWSWVEAMNMFLGEYGDYLKWIPGLTCLIERLFARVGPRVQAEWSRCQNTSIARQLEDGIRYLDFRVLADGGNFFLVHSMYSLNVRAALKDIRKFVTRPGNREVVIVDFQHAYGMGPAAHGALVELVKSTLVDGSGRSLLVERGSDLTLSSIWSGIPRVVVFYPEVSFVDANPGLWYRNGPNSRIVSSWPNTNDIPTLLTALKGEMESEEIKGFQEAGGFYVLQAVRTPDEQAIIEGLTSALWQRTDCPFLKRLLDWLYQQLGLAKDAPVSIEESAKVTNPAVWRSIMGLDGPGGLAAFGERANIIILDHYYHNEVHPGGSVEFSRYVAGVNVSRYSAKKAPAGVPLGPPASTN